MKEYTLKYWNEKKKRWFTRHFKSFKEAYEHATKKGLHEFEIDGERFYNL